MENSSYIVVPRYVDLNGIMRRIRHSYSESDTLIKYSKEQHSPVSSTSTGTLQLGAPSLYADCERNPGLVADDSEGEIRETLNWKKKGSGGMEAVKESINKHPTDLRNFLKRNLKVDVTHRVKADFWLYCTSIDPRLNRKRVKQMKQTDPKYDYMTKIDKPASFAKQLGHDFGKQIEPNENLKCDSPA